MEFGHVKELLLRSDPQFWRALAESTERAVDFDDLFVLSTLRRKAIARGLARPTTTGRPPLRLALLGGYSLYPFHELLTHRLETAGLACELFVGEYDNYVSEVMEDGGALYRFRPAVVMLLPSPRRAAYPGAIVDSRATVQATAGAHATEVLDLCRRVHQGTAAEIVLCNYPLPARRDLGELRARAPASEWNYRKMVNLELGLGAPPFVRICDVEFLANRSGALAAEDPRRWFESKQPGSPSLLADLSREAAHLILGLQAPPKKVLVLDLDNTLWGGVIGDDGLEGIEIGDTSPRGEAFKAFQKYIASLRARGVLLAICSKNDEARALEAFEKHPEMVLKTADLVAFKANWEPKSDNLRRIAADLNLGLDAFVFADDNPAEIEIVRQFTPEVATILLDGDPATFVGRLQDCGLFEPRSITSEDLERTTQYRAEKDREQAMASTTDMTSFLRTLEMKAVIRDFASLDVPRIAQLINKSNQFNLTTRRRSEGEVRALLDQPDHICLSVRLRDRFGDHGLISVIIGRVDRDTLEIDTWLMSCRVLNRQVEDAVLNELSRLARLRGCARLTGVYLATPRNEMVKDFYSRMGFNRGGVTPSRGDFTLDLASFEPRETQIATTEN